MSFYILDYDKGDFVQEIVDQSNQQHCKEGQNYPSLHIEPIATQCRLHLLVDYLFNSFDQRVWKQMPLQVTTSTSQQE